MKKLVLPLAVVAALLLVGLDANTADAARFRISYGGYGYGYNSCYSPWYGGGYGPSWHDTSHLHWHSGGYVPHGNHFDYVPGHFDVHHTGHLHW